MNGVPGITILSNREVFGHGFKGMTTITDPRHAEVSIAPLEERVSMDYMEHHHRILHLPEGNFPYTLDHNISGVVVLALIDPTEYSTPPSLFEWWENFFPGNERGNYLSLIVNNKRYLTKAMIDIVPSEDQINYRRFENRMPKGQKILRYDAYKPGVIKPIQSFKDGIVRKLAS